MKSGKNKRETMELMRAQIDSWLRSDELADIVKSFGENVPLRYSTIELAEWMLEFSDHWDYRANQRNAQEHSTGEAARWLITNEGITAPQEKAVKKGIEPLGLAGIEQPMKERYDYIFALGGARMSCLYRPKYACQLVEEKGLAPKAVVMLSGMRVVSETERAATDTYAPEAKTEFELINAGAEQVFSLPKEYWEERYVHQNPNRAWAVRTYDTDQYNYQIISISGPSSDPENRRANSADTFRFFCEKYRIEKGSSILLVTSQIYVPYQQMEAIRTWAMPNDVYVETIGFPTTWNNSRQQGMMTTANYLQEIRSMIQAISRYLKDTAIYN